MPLKLQIFSESGYQWLGWCKNRLAALALIRQPGQILRQSYGLPGNLLAQVISSDLCDIIRIWGGIGGFITHPRNVLHPFGLDLEGKDLSLLSDFPLVDDDHGSAILDLEGKAEWSDEENYGNMIFVSEDEALSWRGPSGGYILNDPAQRIEGFAKQFKDYALYTPLSPNLYQSGEVLEVMPGNVRCAAVIAGVFWVVIEVEGTDELRMQQDGEWVVIASRPAETYLGTAIPCIFQQDKVVLQKGEWTLNGNWTGYAEPQGTLTRGAGWNITKTADGIILYPGVTASLRSTDTTIVNDAWDKNPGSVPVFVPKHWEGTTEYCPPQDTPSFSADGLYKWTLLDSEEVTSSCATPFTAGCFVVGSSVVVYTVKTARACSACDGYNVPIDPECFAFGCSECTFHAFNYYGPLTYIEEHLGEPCFCEEGIYWSQTSGPGWFRSYVTSQGASTSTFYKKTYFVEKSVC